MENRGPEPTTLRVKRDGYDLHAEVIAPECENAPWIVFSNSLVTNLTIWDAQATALAGRFGLLRYDQAGHGSSEVPRGAVDFDDLGADLVAVMDASCVARAIFVGVSMGVPTGLSAHRITPDRFSAFIFSDGQARTAPGGAAGWSDRIAGAQSTGMEVFAATTADRWLTASAGAPTRARLVQMIAATPFDGFRACASALMDYDYTDQLGRVFCPTLLLAGTQDGAIRESMAANLLPKIDGAELRVIPQAGHIPCFEQPGAFNAALYAFLRNHFGEFTR